MRSKYSNELNEGETVLSLPTRGILDTLFSRNRIATLSKIDKVENNGKYSKVQMRGISRTRLKRVFKFRYAEYEVVEDSEEISDVELMEDLRKKSQELIFLINVDESDKLIHLLNYLNNINQLTDFIANYFIVKFHGRYSIFNELTVKKRAGRLINILNNLINKLKSRREKEIE